MAKSRPERWSEACEEARRGLEALMELQEEYRDWLSNLPENLQSSSIADKLNEIDALDISTDIVDECEGVDLPRGFGRD